MLVFCTPHQSVKLLSFTVNGIEVVALFVLKLWSNSLEVPCDSKKTDPE
jgi:hypothetical protein